MSTQKLTIKGGTAVVIDGHLAMLAGDADIQCANEDFDALRAFSTTPYVEYPKAIEVDGVAFTARNAAHEAELRGERVDPLNDIDTDGAAGEPGKPVRKKK